MTLLATSFVASLLAVLTMRLAARRDPAGSPVLTAGSLLLLLALPLLAALPKFELVLPAAASAPFSSPATVLPPLGLLWLLGFGVFALRFLADHRALACWKSRALPCPDPRLRQALADCQGRLGLRRNVMLRIHPAITSPAIAGLIQPVIFLPPRSRDWPDDTLRMVLLHELGHLARRDLWVSLAARLACLIHWFNPLAWTLRRQLAAQCEFACDTFVIAAGAHPATYATALCDVAEAASPTPVAALAMAGPAPLRQRVERLMHRPRRVTPFLIAAALVGTVGTSVALSVVRFRSEVPSGVYPPGEVQLRLTADPFPGN